jgi:hypothetical protein
LLACRAAAGTEQQFVNSTYRTDQAMASSNNNDPEQGDIEFRIAERPNFGFYFDERNHLPPDIDSLGRITTIDHRQTKGMLLAEVQKLARGPAGSKVKFGLVSIHGHQATIILERKIQIASSHQWSTKSKVAIKSALDALDLYDSDELPNDYLRAAYAAETAGLEPLSTGAFNASVSLCSQWFDENSTTAIVTLMSAAQHYDLVGRFGQAEEAISKAVSAVSRLGSSGHFYQRTLFRFAKFLQDTERYSDAEKVLKKLTEVAEKSSSTPQLAYRSYANLLVQQNRIDEAELLQEKILEIQKERLTDTDLELVADFYAFNGKQDKALEIHTELINGKGKNDIENLSPNARVIFIRNSYKLANLQEKAKDYDKAIKTLQKVLNYYNEKLSTDQQNDLERLPGDSKTASDIERKLGEIIFKTGDANTAASYQEAAIKKLERALGGNSGYLHHPLIELANSYQASGKSKESEQAKARAQGLDPLPKIENVEAIEIRNRKAIITAYKSIHAKDFDTASSASSTIINAYAEACANTTTERQRCQFIHCLTYFASLYIDQGNFEQAKKLIEEITGQAKKNGEAVPSMLSLMTDKAIFAKQLKFDEEDCWHELESSLAIASQDSMRTNKLQNLSPNPAEQNDQSIGEALRRWAMAYSFSSDYKRAKIILQRAVRKLAVAPDYSSVESSSSSSSAYTPPVLLADLAIADANLGDSAKAKSSLKKLMSSNQNLGVATALKIALLATTYSKLGQTNESENLLNEAIRSGVYLNRSDSRTNVCVPGLFQWKLAELQLADRSLVQANINAALAQYRSAPPLKLLVMSADTNFARGQFKAAAHQYVLAQKYYNQMHIQFDPGMTDQKVQLLVKALEAADKSKELPDNELLEILTNLGDSLVIDKRHEAVKIYERAIALLPPDSKEKASLAMKLAQLSHGSQGKSDDFHSKMKVAAEIAEQSGNDFAYQMWLAQAITELRAKQTDNGLVSIGQALRLYKNLTKKKNIFHPLFAYQENTILFELVRLRLTSEAEHLVKEAIEAASKLYGANSDEAAISLIELANLYAAEGQCEKAITVANDVVNIYSLNGAQLPLDSRSSRHEAIYRLYEAAKRIAGKHEEQKAIDLLTKLLAVQIEKLPENNAQIAYTNFELGALYKTFGELNKAEPFYKKTFEIFQELFGQGRMSSYYRGEYTEILRRNGKNNEAESLTTYAAGSTSKLEISAKINQLQSNARRKEMEGQADQALALLEQVYELGTLESPYGSSALRALEELAKMHANHKQYDQAVKRYTQILEILKLDVSTTPRMRTRTMLELAKIYAITGRINQASETLRDARRFDPNIRYERSSPRDLLVYAKIEIDLGQPTEAAKDLEAAELIIARLADDKQRHRHELQSIANLWRRLGNPERSNFVPSQADELKEKLEPHSPSHGVYMGDVQKRIIRAWLPSSAAAGLTMIAQFKVGRNGEMSGLYLSHSSGVEEEDQKALQAIKNASPFRPLPSDFKDLETFEFTFSNQRGPSTDGMIRRL